MKQETKFIDLTRSFVPIDPSKYPNNYHDTQREDIPEDAPPVVAYEGYNFMPTSQGYKSYFGINSQLGIDDLPAEVDKLLLFQTAQYVNILIALCADGIWTKVGEETGAWQHEIELVESTEEKHYEWTYCVLENNLYVYRQESPVYWKILSGISAEIAGVAPAPTGLVVSSADEGNLSGTYEVALAYRNTDNWITAPTAFSSINLTLDTIVLTFPKPADVEGDEYRVYVKSGELVYRTIVYTSDPTTITIFVDILGDLIELPDDDWVGDEGVIYDTFYPVTPEFLNMEGQLGIFAAGIRLGFWDSANSISWSSIDDYADFTPSIETLAGSAIFADVSGRIVTIQGHGDGFLVYSTKGIVYIRRMVEATFQWDPKIVLNTGISYPDEMVSTIPNTIHFAFTHTGIYKIEEGREEVIVPDVYDYLKPMRTPVYLGLLEGRYLVFHIIDPLFLLSQVTFKVDTVPRTTIDFPSDYEIDPISSPSLLEGNDACYTFQGLNQTFDNAGASAVNASEFDWGPHWFSLYNAYYSFGGLPPTLEFVPGCNAKNPDGSEASPRPIGGTAADVSQDETHKYVVQDTPEEWYYRNNSEKFVATQLALWKLADAEMAARLAQILAFSSSFEETDGGVYFPSPDPVENPVGPHGLLEADRNAICPIDNINGVTSTVYCDLLTTLILDWSNPVWGLSPCSLYLTRYATKRGKLYLKTVTRKFCKSEETINSNRGWHDIYNGGPNTKAMGSPTEVIIAVITHYNNYFVLPVYSSHAYRYLPTSGIRGSWHKYLGEGSMTLYVSIAYYFIPGSVTYGNEYEYTVEIRDIEEGIFAVDTAYLELAGWYNSENYAQIVPRGATCKPPVIALPDNDSSTRGGSIPISDLDGSICGIPFDPIVIPGLFDAPIQWPSQSISYPASAFLLQKGSVAPFYPTFYGALVYDLHLKKWGKMKHEYKQLFDYQPINGKQGNIVSFPTFGVEAGLMNASGTIFIFDEFPNDSYIKYGKIGYYRQGFTHCEEIRIQFGSEADAVLTLEASLDGKFQEATLQRSTNLTNVMDGILLANTSARWYNIKVSGIYDLTYLEFRGTQGSRR